MILVVGCWGGLALAQESDVPTTRDINSRLRKQLDKNDKALKVLLNKADTTVSGSLKSLDSLTFQRPRSRGLEVEEPPDFFQVDFNFMQDQTYRLLDPNGNPGFLLTGKWISDYARKIKLVPALEKTLAGYRKQTELQNQMIGEFETTIGIKDQKNGVLEEINRALKERGDLYKAKSELLSDPWYKKLFRTLSYPIGFTAGVFVGVIIANNS